MSVIERQFKTEQSDVDEIIRYVIGSLAVDGLYPSEEATALCNAIVNGYMTGNQAVEQIKRMYGIESR